MISLAQHCDKCKTVTSHTLNNYDLDGGKVADFVDGMVKGAKWQAERMYSEEDMKLAWEDGRDGTSVVGNFPFTKTVFTHRSFNEWFEKFKKK
jgi:hypothetical protein